MNIQLNDIKEVEIIAKKEFKYFMLFIYNSKTRDLNDKYCMLCQSTNVDDIEEYKKSWSLQENDEFRVFEFMLPI